MMLQGRLLKTRDTEGFLGTRELRCFKGTRVSVRKQCVPGIQLSMTDLASEKIAE